MRLGPREELPVLNFTEGALYWPNSLHVELENLLGSSLLVAANTRGGKSFLLRGLLEQTHGRVHQLVIDPEGQLHTLREKFAYVLAAVEGGDVPVTLSTARELPQRLMKLGANAIIDVSEMKKDVRDEYLRLFFEELVELPRALWHQVLVVIDEIHLVCPERGFDESVATRAVVDLASRGLKRGYSLVGATQRVAKFAKSASSDFSNRLFGRTVELVDRERMGKELGLPRKLWDTFQHLRQGEFYASGPSFGDGVTLARAGPVLTLHPRAGQVAPPPAPTPDELKEVLAGLANLAQAAAEQEKEAKSREELEQQVRELKAQLLQARAERPAPPTPPPPPVEVPVLTEADRQEMAGAATAIREGLHLLASHVADLDRNILVVGAKVGVQAPAPAGPLPPGYLCGHFDGRHYPRGALCPPAEAAGAPPATTAAPLRVVPQVELPLEDQRRPAPVPRTAANELLELLAKLRPDAVTREKLLVLSGMAEAKVRRRLPVMLRLGLVKEHGAEKWLAITAAGLEVVPGVAPATRDELVELWCARLKLLGRVMLRVLVTAHPRSLAPEELAVEVGKVMGVEPMLKTFRNRLSELRTLGLVADEPNGRICASAGFFHNREVARAG